jgi:hypothetical protein
MSNLEKAYKEKANDFMNKLGAANDAISKYASDKIAEIAKRSNIPGDKLAGVLSNSDARNLKTILTKPFSRPLAFASSGCIHAGSLP